MRWKPAFRITILILICSVSTLVRIFSVIRYESIIHEFDPWFNYRATKFLVNHDFKEFWNFFDSESWYPLGRNVGATVYPGLMVIFNLFSQPQDSFIFCSINLLFLLISETFVFSWPQFSHLSHQSLLTYWQLKWPRNMAQDYWLHYSLDLFQVTCQDQSPVLMITKVLLFLHSSFHSTFSSRLATLEAFSGQLDRHWPTFTWLLHGVDIPSSSTSFQSSSCLL